jgi:hypothetical protein
MKGVLSSSIEFIRFGYSYKEVFNVDVFPNNLKTIQMSGNETFTINNLPHTVETIIFELLRFKLDNLPSTVTKIKLLFRHPHYNYSKLLNKIPFGCSIVDHREKIINFL